MSGILNKKNRIIDYRLTENGRKQIQNGDIKFKYYTLSDSSLVYHQDFEAIDNVISDSEYFYMPFEVSTDPFQYVNPEFNQITESNLTINKTSLSWIFTDEQRYTTPIISFNSNPVQIINEDESKEYKPVTFQTTNYIGVQAYFTLILNVGALGRENN